MTYQVSHPAPPNRAEAVGPPPSNTGVIHAQEGSDFDWYAATVESDVDDLIGLMVASRSLCDGDIRQVPGLQGYAFGVEVRREGCRSAVVYSGGPHPHPHVIGSGADAAHVARLLRSRFPASHRVARVDARFDTDAPGSFVRLHRALKAQAARSGVHAHMIQPDDPDAGATYYVGSTKSDVMARLYEKGKQLKDAQRPDWTRFEVQMKPQKDRKVWAASASPAEILGASLWSRKFVANTLGIVAASPPVRPERVSDLEGSLRALTTQYGGRLRELVAAYDGDLAGAMAELIERADHGGIISEPQPSDR